MITTKEVSTDSQLHAQDVFKWDDCDAETFAGMMMLEYGKLSAEGQRIFVRWVLNRTCVDRFEEIAFLATMLREHQEGGGK